MYTRSRLNVTYPSTLLLKDYGLKIFVEKVRFLHIPKTGTTFAATILHYFCSGLDNIFTDVIFDFKNILQPWKLDRTCKERILVVSSKNGDWWMHHPFRNIDFGFGVTIMRDPITRLASQVRN